MLNAKIVFNINVFKNKMMIFELKKYFFRVNDKLENKRFLDNILLQLEKQGELDIYTKSSDTNDSAKLNQYFHTKSSPTCHKRSHSVSQSSSRTYDCVKHNDHHKRDKMFRDGVSTCEQTGRAGLGKRKSSSYEVRYSPSLYFT